MILWEIHNLKFIIETIIFYHSKMIVIIILSFKNYSNIKYLITNLSFSNVNRIIRQFILSFQNYSTLSI